MSYDPRCHDLAVIFLPAGSPSELIAALAQEIQNAIEAFLEEKGIES